MLPTRYYATNHNFLNASQKNKNMTRVKREVINVKVVLEFMCIDIDNTARNFISAPVPTNIFCFLTREEYTECHGSPRNKFNDQ
jgi:hypothetical protein